MANNIFKEAKRLRAKYPKRYSDWQEYVAEATDIYHSKKGGSMPKKKAKKRKPAARKAPKKRRTKRTIGKVKPLPHGSVTFHVSHVKRLLKDEIGKLAANKFTAKTKTAKKKIQKKITEKQSQYRRLM